MQVSIFNWASFLPEIYISVNVFQFIRFVNIFKPPAKCHEETEYHSNIERES